MKKILYKCNNTGEIKEEPYGYKEVQFSVVKKYEPLYKEALPRFVKSGNPDIYALPFGEVPKKIYRGLDRMGIDDDGAICSDLSMEQQEIVDRLYDEYGFLSEEYPLTESEAETLLGCFDKRDEFELIWSRISGSEKKIPDGYSLAGYDVAYPPDCSGGFSIICDCMFICKWHGCDSEGTLFSKDFGKLNENGLFDCAEDAYIYMVSYLGEDWSERGEFGIFEVYIKQL